MKLIALLLTLAVIASPSFAADAATDQKPAAETAKQDPADLEQRVELSKKLHALMPTPVRQQVYNAIDQIAQQQPPAQQEAFKSSMRNVLNVQALEKISIDAMAETYTLKELQAQYDYYSTDEAKSSAAKYQQYAQKVNPEIIRMLDQAVMKVRTGGTGQ